MKEFIVNRTTREEYLNISDELAELEKDKQIIRLDMNTIEFPIFSKNTRRKKNETLVYYFKTDKSSYLEVNPTRNEAIPGEFEERVFIALIKIMRDYNYGRTFIVPANIILDNLSLGNENFKQYYPKLKKAMKSLTSTGYIFKNSLYSNKLGGIIDEEIHTTIMNILIITRKDKFSEEIEYFEDGRVKEVYQVSLSDYFYDNIIRKGYLTFDSKKLLAIENAVTRSIYTILEKWRGYNLYLKRPAFFIARRIPLTWDKSNITKTIKTMEKACNELKSMNIIESFKIIKESKWELAEFEFNFTEEHNKIKRNSFYQDKKETNFDMEVTGTEKKESEKKIKDAEIEEEKQKERLKLEQEELYNQFLALSESKQKLIENEVRESYLKEAGMQNKASDDSLRKSILNAFEKSKKLYISKYMKNYTPIKTGEIYEEAEIIEEKPKINEPKSNIRESQIENPIVNINKKFISFGAFLLEVIKSLNKIEVSEQDRKGILELLPILKSYEDKLNDYMVKIEFNEDGKNGIIEIKKL